MAESQQHRLDWEEGAQSFEELNIKLQRFFADTDDMLHTLFVQAQAADTGRLTAAQISARIHLRV